MYQDRALRRLVEGSDDLSFPSTIQRVWPKVEPALAQILRHASRVIRLSEPPSNRVDQAFHVLMCRGVLQEEGPFVTTSLVLLVLLRKDDSQQERWYEARDLRLLAPWVVKRWRKGKRFDPELIVQMCQTLTDLMTEHFPREQQDTWFVFPEVDHILVTPTRRSARTVALP